LAGDLNRPIEKRRKGHQPIQPDKGTRRQGLNLSARRSVEHPRRDLKPSLDLRSLGRAPKNRAIRLVDYRVDGHLAVDPGVKPIQDFTPSGPVGVLKLCCTTLSGVIRHWIMSVRFRSKDWPDSYKAALH
jgi:hypothetical protein